MKADETKFRSEQYQAALGKIEKLVDPQSFSQIGAYMEDDNIIGGFATIDARPYYIYCQYGPVNLNHAGKISRVYKMAKSMGAPVIALLDSDGINMSEGLDVLACYGEMFTTMSDAGGVIPKYSIIYGKCMGANAVISGLSDFTFGLKDTKLFIQSPNTAEDVKSVGVDKFLNANYHYQESGEIDFLYNDADSLNNGFKHFLSFMPLNNLEESPIQVGTEQGDDLPEFNADSDVKKIIESICDNGDYIEASAGFAKELGVYFARFEGFCAAIIGANGTLSENAIKKAVKFISFCDAFNIPVITLGSVTGFDSSTGSLKNSVTNAASLASAFSNATVAKINIVTKNAIGLGGLCFNSAFIGADLVYTWNGAKIALFTDEQLKVLGDKAPTTEPAEKKGYVDEIIEPSQTRKVIICALENLLTKRVFKHPKKHGSVFF